MQAGAKIERHFGECQPPRRGGKQIQEVLEPLTRQRAHRLGKGLPPDHKEPAHRVGEVGLDDEPPELAGKIADHDARALHVANTALFDVAAGDDDIEALGLELGKHRGQQVLVMLQVAIHDGGVGRRGGEDALDAGRCQAASAEPLQTADIGLVAPQRAHDPCTAPGVRYRGDVDPSDLGIRHPELAGTAPSAGHHAEEEEPHHHAPAWLMSGPVAVLIPFSILIGWLNYGGENSPWHRFFEGFFSAPGAAQVPAATPAISETVSTRLVLIVVAIGIAVAPMVGILMFFMYVDQGGSLLEAAKAGYMLWLSFVVLSAVALAIASFSTLACWPSCVKWCVMSYAGAMRSMTAVIALLMFST